jgi:hypothetical protein
MRITLPLILASLLAPPFVWGQKLELKLDHLKAKASDSAEVDLDGSALELALKSGLQNFVKPGKQFNAEQIKQVIAGLKGVYVRHFEFAKPGEYSDVDVESVVKQVQGDPAWARLLRVKEKDERVEIYLQSKADQIAGVLVLVAEAKELTVVNVVGTIALDQLKELVSSTLHYDLKNLPGKEATP